MTGTAIINEALQLIGILAPGRSAATEEYNQALIVLNQIVSSWSADPRGIFQITRDTFVVTGSNTYTYGPSAAHITAARPKLILAAGIVASGSSFESPCKIVGAEAWHAIADKTRTGKFARILYCDYGMPNSNIYLWPAPATGGVLSIEALKALTQWTNLATDLSLPEGYDRALAFNLAVSLFPIFAGARMDPGVPAIAVESRETIFALNERLLLAAAGPQTSAPEVPAQ